MEKQEAAQIREVPNIGYERMNVINTEVLIKEGLKAKLARYREKLGSP